MGLSPTQRPAGYAEFLRDIERRVGESRVRAAFAVNSELVLFYWRMGLYP